MTERPMVMWICERRSRAVSTILIKATSRREAQRMLDNHEGDAISTEHYAIGRAKVIKRDRKHHD